MMIELLRNRLKAYARELGRVEGLIESERITNQGHTYHKTRIGLEAKIELVEELLYEAIRIVGGGPEPFPNNSLND